jgi:tRNA(Ile)-lysidine synthase
MLEFLKVSLSDPCDFQPGKPVVVGFSGGADSVCLLHALHKTGLPLIAAHFNHQLRPTASLDEGQAAGFAGQLGVPFVSGTQDVRRYARQEKMSLEAAARQLRYQFLFDQAALHQAQAVAVAHHADDQVETVLLHIVRGSGSDGLQGMAARWLPNPWSEVIPLVRPLLSTWKQDILAYCADHQLAFCEDESNTDQAFRRNAIRHSILPALEDINPQVRQALWRLAQISRADQEFVSNAAGAAWQVCLHSRGAHSVSLDAHALRAQPVAIQRMVLRRALIELRPGIPDVNLAAIERVRAAVARDRVGLLVDLVGGIRAQTLGATLRLVTWEGATEREWPQLVVNLEVAPGFALELENDWVFTCHSMPQSAALAQAIYENGDPFQAWVDLGSRHEPLTLCPRWPGARIQPLGMLSGSVKLSDLMINHKIPRPARAAWPLLCAGSQVIWAPGMAVSQVHRVMPQSAGIFHLSLFKRSGSELNREPV